MQRHRFSREAPGKQWQRAHALQRKGGAANVRCFRLSFSTSGNAVYALRPSEAIAFLLLIAAVFYLQRVLTTFAHATIYASFLSFDAFLFLSA